MMNQYNIELFGLGVLLGIGLAIAAIVALNRLGDSPVGCISAGIGLAGVSFLVAYLLLSAL